MLTLLLYEIRHNPLLWLLATIALLVPSTIAQADQAPGAVTQTLSLGLALATLAGVTVLVALVSEVFVESVQKAAEAFGLPPQVS